MINLLKNAKNKLILRAMTILVAMGDKIFSYQKQKPTQVS